MTDTYNGWTNYETWCAALWADNDSNGYWSRTAQEILRQQNNDKGDATYELSLLLKDQHDELMPVVEGLYADLLGASMSRINWHEIAGHYIDEVFIDSPDEIEE